MATLQSSLGKPDAAMSSYTQALQLLQDIGMKKEYGSVLLNRGVLHESRGEYDKALQDYKDSLQSRETPTTRTFRLFASATLRSVLTEGRHG